MGVVAAVYNLHLGQAGIIGQQRVKERNVAHGSGMVQQRLPRPVLAAQQQIQLAGLVSQRTQ